MFFFLYLNDVRTYRVMTSLSLPLDCKCNRALTADWVEESVALVGESYSTHWLPPSSAENYKKIKLQSYFS